MLTMYGLPGVPDIAGFLTGSYARIAETLGAGAVRDAFSEAAGATASSGSGPPSSGSSDSMAAGALAAAIIVPVAATLLAAAALLVALRQLRRRHRDLLGRVRVPRAGHETTLLISDVQVRWITCMQAADCSTCNLMQP